MTTPLQVETLALGPVETNAYVVADIATLQCVVIDAAWDAPLLEERKPGLKEKDVGLKSPRRRLVGN